MPALHWNVLKRKQHEAAVNKRCVWLSRGGSTSCSPVAEQADDSARQGAADPVVGGALAY